MTENRYVFFACALGVSFLISAFLTEAARRLALRWAFLDHPGERKMQEGPVPLMGGAAIFITFYVVTLALLSAMYLTDRFGGGWLVRQIVAGFGEHATHKIAGVLIGGLLIFLLGILDDLKALNPEVKVILSSGYGYEGIMQKMQKDGLAGFQQKPYSLENLGQTIRQLFS